MQKLYFKNTFCQSPLLDLDNSKNLEIDAEDKSPVFLF